MNNSTKDQSKTIEFEAGLTIIELEDRNEMTTAPAAELDRCCGICVG